MAAFPFGLCFSSMAVARVVILDETSLPSLKKDTANITAGSKSDNVSEQTASSVSQIPESGQSRSAISWTYTRPIISNTASEPFEKLVGGGSFLRASVEASAERRRSFDGSAILSQTKETHEWRAASSLGESEPSPSRHIFAPSLQEAHDCARGRVCFEGAWRQKPDKRFFGVVSIIAMQGWPLARSSASNALSSACVSRSIHEYFGLEGCACGFTMFPCRLC